MKIIKLEKRFLISTYLGDVVTIEYIYIRELKSLLGDMIQK